VPSRILAFVLTVAAAVPSFSATKNNPPQRTALPPLAASAFPLPVPEYLTMIISEAAELYRVDPNLIAAMAFRESRFKTNDVSWRGAQGIMQLMPRTARYLGVTNPLDPRQNVLGGTKYLRMMLDRFDGNLDLALAAYNAGPELVAKAGPGATKEAVEYVAAVKQYYLAAMR
jgi:soluble lytic murein transglycosylase-like protein